MVWVMYFAIYMKLLNSWKVLVSDWNAVFDPKIDGWGANWDTNTEVQNTFSKL